LVTRNEYTIGSPAAATETTLAVFTTVSAGACVTGSSAVDEFEVTDALSGDVPVAVAVFAICPRSTSAWVTLYVDVQITCAPGASELVGQEIADIAPGPAPGRPPEPLKVVSTGDTFVIVWLPVLVMTKENVTVAFATRAAFGQADFTSDSESTGAMVTLALDAPDVAVPPAGVVPDAVAVFVICPASTSAWVTRYEAVHVTDAAGAREFAAAGHVSDNAGPDPENAVSAGFTLVRVTLPVLVIRKE
jgi:hypothetical protein